MTRPLNQTGMFAMRQRINRSHRNQRYYLAFHIDTLRSQMNKGWKFLKKLWCCVGGGNKVIWLYQLSWKRKLTTVMSYKADVSSVSPLSERIWNANQITLRSHCMFYGERTCEEPLHVERMCGCLLMIINFFLVLWTWVLIVVFLCSRRKKKLAIYMVIPETILKWK